MRSYLPYKIVLIKRSHYKMLNAGRHTTALSLDGSHKRKLGEISSVHSELGSRMPGDLGYRDGPKLRVPYLLPTVQQQKGHGNSHNPMIEMGPTFENGSRIPGTTSTPGYMTNGKYSYARTMPEYKRPFYKESKVDQLIFTKRTLQQNVTNGRGINIGDVTSKSNFGPYLSRTRNVMLPLASLNYLLAHSEPSYNTMDEVPDAEECWQDWTIEGIARNESLQTPTTFSRGRTVNCYIRGAMLAMHSIWPLEKLTGRCALFGILKRTKVDRSTFVLDKAHSDPWTSRINDSIDQSNQDSASLNPCPFQFFPYVSPDRQTSVPEEALLYKDQFGRKCRGKAIYIGTYDGPLCKPNGVVSEMDIMRNTTSMVHTGKIYVYLDPSG